MNTARTIAQTLSLGAVLVGVSSTGGADHAVRSPYVQITEHDRRTARAEELTYEAAVVILTNAAHVERLLREALAVGVCHGPAHTNLGVIYLERGKLYSTVGESERARKLMPGNAPACMNLALVFERAGRIDEAISRNYSELEVQPGYFPSIQALMRPQIRYDKRDDATRSHLETIALRGQLPWDKRARSLLNWQEPVASP